MSAVLLWALLLLAYAVVACGASAVAVADAMWDAELEPPRDDTDRLIRWLADEGQLLLDAERRRAL